MRTLNRLFVFNLESGRWAIGEQDLHCGDCFQILERGEWFDCRIEMSGQEWYLIGAPFKTPSLFEYQEARFYDAAPTRVVIAEETHLPREATQ